MLGGDNANNVVLISHMAVDSDLQNSSISFCSLQFPVHLVYAMTINKSQDQMVKHIGSNLSSSVFFHGPLYVALLCCTCSKKIKTPFPHGQENTKAINVVLPKVIRNLDI